MSSPPTPPKGEKPQAGGSGGRSKGRGRKVIGFSKSPQPYEEDPSQTENQEENQEEMPAAAGNPAQQEAGQFQQPGAPAQPAENPEYATGNKSSKPVQYSPVPPPPSVDEETLKRRAAEARAYALSGTSKKKAKAALPMKPTYAYGRPGYPNYGPPPPGPAAATNPQHRPPHPYHHPPPPHYYYEYPPPPPPGQQHGHHRPSHPPHYPYYHAPPPYGYHYPPPPPHTAPGPAPAGAPGATSANPSYPPPPAPPYAYSPPNPAAAQLKAESGSTSPRPGASTKPKAAGKSTNGVQINTNAASKRQSYLSSTPPKNSLAHTISGAQKIPVERRDVTMTSRQSKSTEQAEDQGVTVDPLMTLNPLRFDDEDDDYVKFVRSLGLNDAESVLGMPEDDDEEDFMLTNLDEDEEDDEEEEEDDDEVQPKDGREAMDTSGSETADKKWEADSADAEMMPAPSSPTKRKSTSYTLDLPEFDPNFYRELEDELGGLEEEDLEAAVASLLGTTSTAYAHAQKLDANDGAAHAPRGENISSLFAAEANANETEQATVKAEPDNELGSPNADLEMGTPLRAATGMRTKTMVTVKQVERLQALLNRHYQILVQQAVLAIQAAHLNKTHRFRDKTDFLSGETADDLVQVLDAAVGMVQDLDQNRKDAIRNAIQFEDASPMDSSRSKGTASYRSRGRVEQDEEDAVRRPQERAASSLTGEAGVPRDQRRLTRAAFSKTLQEHTERKSVFNVKGLHRLQETFHALDRSIGSGASSFQEAGESSFYMETCRGMLKQAGADYEEHLLPGKRDLSALFSTPEEYLGQDFQPPSTEEQERFLRRFRTLFTSGEDNLVLRGVNLYGEKQWILIADRYLPDRSINNISQRYSKLCVMLYKAHDIRIDTNGCLDTPPKLESVEDIDDEKVALIKKAAPPAILNVHRWSLEEDLTLLRAVPLMGHMWAELGARLIPHRDRGHLRKRYQVLERRVKATVTRFVKGHDSVAKVASKLREKDRQQRPRLEPAPAPSRPMPPLPHPHQMPYPHRYPPPHPGPIPPHLRPYQAQPIPLAPRGPPPGPPPALHPARPTAPAPAQKPPTKPVPTANPPTRAPPKAGPPKAAPPKSSAPTKAAGPKAPPPPPPKAAPTRTSSRKAAIRPLQDVNSPTRASSRKPATRPLPTANPPNRASSRKPATQPLPNAKAPPVATTRMTTRRSSPPKAQQDRVSTRRTAVREAQEEDEDETDMLGQSSRAAFEDLVSANTGDWSQLDRIKELMENEVESEIVGTLANRMAKPQATATRPPKPAAGGKKGPSILTSVLERANSRAPRPNKGVKRKNTLPTTRTSKRIAAAAAKQSPALKSPLLSRPGSSGSKKAPPPAASGGSPEINSKLFAGGNGTLDGFKFEDLETKGAADSNGSARSKISANDLEAISALNSLSNSPALLKPAAKPTSPTTRSKKGNEEDKSFFAKITGRVQERDSKRKRKLDF